MDTFLVKLCLISFIVIVASSFCIVLSVFLTLSGLVVKAKLDTISLTSLQNEVSRVLNALDGYMILPKT